MTSFNLNLNSDEALTLSPLLQWSGPTTDGFYYKTLTVNKYYYDEDVDSGGTNSTLGSDQSTPTRQAKFGFENIPRTPGESVKQVKVWYASLGSDLMDASPPEVRAAGIKQAILTIAGSVVGTLTDPVVTVLDGEGVDNPRTFWHYIVFEDLDIDLNSIGTTNNAIELDAGDHQNYSDDWYINNLYIEVITDTNIPTPYTSITIDDATSDSPTVFSKNEGESFEIELYHDGTVDIGTTIDFTIAASPNDGGGFALSDIASVTVDGVAATQTYVLDSQKTQKIVITLATGINAESTEYFRLTFATTDSAGNLTQIDDAGNFSSWNTENLAQTFDMRIADVIVVNADPTLDALSNLTINEDASQQTVSLAGISAGSTESQTLRVTASSNNLALIPNPTVTYTSPNATGSLAFTPVANKFGTATITVTVEDAGTDDDLSTASDNATFSRTFTVTVNAVNDPPTLDSLSNIIINEDDPEQTVSLTGITSGNDSHPLSVTASSDNTGLIPNPTVTYTSPLSTGSLKFTPVLNQFGTAIITVTVQHAGIDGDLSTTGDNASITRQFSITVNPMPEVGDSYYVLDIDLTSHNGLNSIKLSTNDTAKVCRIKRYSNPRPVYLRGVGTNTLTAEASISSKLSKIPVNLSASLIGLATPRTTICDQGITGATIDNGGAGYGTGSCNPVLTVTGGGGDGATMSATVTDGVITSVAITNPGSGYTSAPRVTINSDSNIPTFAACPGYGAEISTIVDKFNCRTTTGLTVDYSVNQKLDISGILEVTHADKFAGDFGDYECSQKLFPISDIPIVSGLGNFVGPHNESSGLYSFIDEGIFTGDYDKKFGQTLLISDDRVTFIHPSSIHTSGQFEYRCGVTTPLIMPDQTRLRIRASAPLTNLEAKIAPRYTIEDIKFEDPFGNVIVQYDDIILRGDANHDSLNHVNYTTYSSNSKINNTSKFYSWEEGYPSLHDSGVYSLYFKIKADALDDAFDTGFDLGFEENYILPETTASGDDYLGVHGSPLGTMAQGFFNPINAIKISALEICNSGGHGPRMEDVLNFYTEVRSTGHRIERSIYPSLVPVTSFDTNIYPSVSSVWYANNNPEFSNTTTSGALKVLENLNNTNDAYSITLHSTDFADSGKLTLKMSHDGMDKNRHEVTNGDFNIAFDGAIPDTCVKTGAFNREKKNDSDINDGFFVVDCVTLKVLAKKQAGSRDYVLDVVGYSDDRILNITSAVGGFLQNVSGVGAYPVSSGFDGDDDLGISSLAISENDQFYESSGNNAGGDHYSLVGSPIVSGTDFAWYDVPLHVYDDKVTLGKSRDYTMSSLFENMYLDIFPLPSGATIANLYLSVRYRPQHALKLITEGGEDIRKISDDAPVGKIYPTSRQSNDSIINAGSGYGPLSTISDIPHAYTTPTTIKSNYSRRWRGMEGTVNGPFDVDQFSFSFYNPLVDFPFLSGFYDFDYDDGLNIIPRVGSLTGTLTTTYSDYRLKNIGWRHTTNNLFTSQLPGYTGSYQTTDWSSLSNGGNNFEGHPLYGQIADAFNNVVRISGHNSNINFGDIDIVPDSGFGMYIRFSPDVNVSGVGYDLFNSGVLFSKWDSGNDLEFALGYASGFLRATAKDTTGAEHFVQDSTAYSDYQYPLSVILTYNDDSNNSLKLYTDNEFEPNWTTLRASSVAPFDMAVGNSNFVVGNSTGSGVGFNMFVSEIGISNSGNVVSSNADATKQQVTAQKFLENNRVFWWDETDTSSNDAYKLWDYVNEDTRDDWTLGDFKYCQFDIAFDQLQKRTGRDLISFNMVHDGSGYVQRTNRALPTNIDSGVAYHTQLENDFLRFHLSDTADNFHSVFRRVTKDLPRGYKFADRALAVETILEHTSSGNIKWNDGNVGPKLIVSLYTKNQDPYWTSDQPNWGLINRDIHYLEASSCLMRIDSTFTYNSISDQTEEWALFPKSRTTTEFKEKYFSQDVDDMFLQYDLVYPSGPAFESRIDVHTAHVKMDDAYVSDAADSGILNLFASGEPRDSDSLNLYATGVLGHSSGSMNLYSLGPVLHQVGSGSVPGLNLYTSGIFRINENLNLYTLGPLQIQAGSGDEPGLNLFTTNFSTIEVNNPTINSITITVGTNASAIIFNNENNTIQIEGLNLQNDYDYQVGGTITITNVSNPIDDPFDENYGTYTITEISSTSGTNDTLTIVNTDGSDPNLVTGSDNKYGLTLSGNYISDDYERGLNFTISGTPPIATGWMPFTALNTETKNIPGDGLLNLYAFVADTLDAEAIQGRMPVFLINKHETNPINSTGALNLKALGTSALISKYRREAMNLTLFNDDEISSGIMNMTLYGDNLGVTSLTGIGSDFSGTGIAPSMNLVVGNYGSTGSDYLKWTSNNYGYPIDVVDNDYASKLASDEIRGVDLMGFGSCTGNSPDKAIDPAIITDGITWREETCNEGGVFRAEETYTNIDASYSGEYYGIRKYKNLKPHTAYLATLKVATGSTDPIAMPRDWEEWEYGTSGTVNFSGVKLTADEPRSLLPSGRNAGDKYGKSVAVDNGLMAISSPLIEIPDDSGHQISSAGSVFLYRRNTDVPGKQAEWALENKLMLPDGYRRDYKGKTIANLLCYPSTQNPEFCVSGQRWHIGQEGREFGHSVDLSSNTDGETIVVGAPGAQWTRTFDTTVVSGIPVCMMVFVDSFSYDETKLGQILNVARKYDVLYRYFSAPWNADTDPFQVELDIKLLVFEISEGSNIPVTSSMPDEFKHTYIEHLDDQDLIDGHMADGNTEEQAKAIIQAGMFSDIKKSFNEMFPHSNALHSGIPPIVGIFSDTSFSTSNGFSFSPAVDDFISYYYDYAYQSGVVNSETLTADSGYINSTGVASTNFATDTIKLLDNTLSTGNLVTATRQGIAHDASKYIASGIGREWANSNAYEFQIPPGSGGRVYVFEKESGVFNLVQSIKSNTEQSLASSFNQRGDEDHYAYSSKRHDRFGHSVSISDNREIIAVGSPYTTTSCQVFERDKSENTRMFNNLQSWLTFREKTTELNRYNDLVIDSGVIAARNTVYHELSQGDKFLLRTDDLFWGNDPIELYKNIYNYGYGNIPYTGTFQFITAEFAGTSRLGYSTAVSEDGDIVAFGAPTDSFNEFDDTNIWYNGSGLNDTGDLTRDNWASYTNAGAVRVFGSRKSYPHSGVVEFYKFGNLDRTLHPDLVSEGYYDQMGTYFLGMDADDLNLSNNNVSFTRTQFEDLEIPRDAGLAFIITPEVDAASDEIVANIKDWLSLGDRTLVIVGNDPVYEDNGVYADSNKIVNKLLEKLGSRMKIHPARNKDESLSECVSQESAILNEYNVVASKVPAYAHSTSISAGSVFAMGVGDIRINVSGDGLQSLDVDSPCDDLNPRCELPIKNDGDLRAEWNEKCTKTEPGTGKKTDIYYKVNWPFHFGNANPSNDCDDPPKGIINRTGQDIRPILTAAEYIPPEPWTIPASTQVSGRKIVTKVDTGETDIEVIQEAYWKYNFAGQHLDNIAFSVSGDGLSNVIGDYASWDKGLFDDPAPLYGRDGILQATTEEAITSPPAKNRQVNLVSAGYIEDGTSTLCTEEVYHNTGGETSSKVLLFASLLPESDYSMGTAAKPAGTTNADLNIPFYNNLIMKDCETTGKGKVYQLGGWTGRTSFKDAYGPSALTDAFNKYKMTGHTSYHENVTYDGNIWTDGTGAEINLDDANVLWIANPTSVPPTITEDGVEVIPDIERIKTWLNGGNRKVVITYGKTQSQDANGYWTDLSQDIARNVKTICDQLGLNSKPWYSDSQEGYLVQASQTLENLDDRTPDEDYKHVAMNTLGDVEAINGCVDGYGWNVMTTNTAVDKVAIRRSNTNHIYDHDDPEEYHYIPIKVGANTTQVIWFNDALYEQFYPPATQARYTTDVAATATFSVEPGSGYRVFYNWVSEKENEELSIEAIVKNVNASAYPSTVGYDVITFDGNPNEGENGDQHDLIKTVRKNGQPNPRSTFVDIKVPDSDSSSVDISISLKANHVRDMDITTNPPATVRLLSVSGCLLPITSGEVPEVTQETPIFETVVTYEDIEHPAMSGEYPGYSRPIMNDNDKYCSYETVQVPVFEEIATSELVVGNDGFVREVTTTNTVQTGVESVDVKCDKGGQLIQDGPVVVAEEVETFSSFSAGNNRSKIVVIADSTIIQGQCSHYRNESFRENQALIKSLYPQSPSAPAQNSAVKNVSRNYLPKQKLLSPERGSAAKLFGVTEIPGLVSRYGNLTGHAKYKGTDLANYNDTENTYVPADVSRPKDPKTGDAFKAKVKSFEDNIIPKFGVFPRYSGDYLDAKIAGGMPPIMLSGGRDHIDFDVNYSGYPGDLFGYSIDIHENKLVVGSPFAGYQYRNSGIENIVTWSGVQVSGSDAMSVNGNGGAGAVYYFEKTGSGINALGSTLDWEFKRKIKPSSINIGLDNATTDDLTEQRGSHGLGGTFVVNHAIRGDQFGHSVSIDEDFLAIGAPNHGFETLHDHIYSGSAAFIRKEFTEAFDIPHHKFYNYDLGSSGVRYSQHMNYGASGKFVLNNGAVFTYRHQMTDWQNRTKQWEYAEKIFADGYSDRNTDLAGTSGTENDFFGTSVAINQAGRGDSDYTLVIGSPNHKFGTSGEHPQPLDHAGAAYTFDAMLREQVDTLPNSGNWIAVDVFGDKSINAIDRLGIKVYQNTSGDSITYETSGIVFSTAKGDIFIEVSGFDPATKGFIAHRPYVESVVGEILNGIPTSGSMFLYVDGKPAEIDNAWPNVVAGLDDPRFDFDSAYDISYPSRNYRPSGMSLSILGPDQADVYNNMNLYTTSWNQLQVGSGNNPFNLTVSGEDATNLSGIMNLFMSGTIQLEENLNLRVRGR